MINNLNDGMAWGLFPVFFTMAGLPLGDVGILVALYPAVWGILQLVTGALSDHLGRKRLIVGGMLLQAIAIWILLVVTNFWIWAGASASLGLGTALVYPTLLAAIGDVAHPGWRASAVGVYRFWRDSGYVIGAVLAGFLADILSVPWSIGIVGGLTFSSGVLVALVMKERGATKNA
nr:MFS transporter [Chloroflexus sp. Y-396-1]